MAMIEDKTIQKCKNILKKHYGTQFKGLIMYGSIVRKQADVESDIDLLLLLSEPFDYFSELSQIIDLLYPIQLESERLLSVKAAAENEFNDGTLQLYRNIKREGKFL